MPNIYNGCIVANTFILNHSIQALCLLVCSFVFEPALVRKQTDEQTRKKTRCSCVRPVPTDVSRPRHGLVFYAARSIFKVRCAVSWSSVRIDELDNYDEEITRGLQRHLAVWPPPTEIELFCRRFICASCVFYTIVIVHSTPADMPKTKCPIYSGFVNNPTAGSMKVSNPRIGRVTVPTALKWIANLLDIPLSTRNKPDMLNVAGKEFGWRLKLANFWRCVSAVTYQVYSKTSISRGPCRLQIWWCNNVHTKKSSQTEWWKKSSRMSSLNRHAEGNLLHLCKSCDIIRSISD